MLINHEFTCNLHQRCLHATASDVQWHVVLLLLLEVQRHVVLLLLVRTVPCVRRCVETLRCSRQSQLQHVKALAHRKLTEPDVLHSSLTSALLYVDQSCVNSKYTVLRQLSVPGEHAWHEQLHHDGSN